VIGTRFGDDALLRRADTVLVLNDTMRRLYLRAGVESSRLRQVPNFLPEPAVTTGPGAGEGPWIFVGRLTEEKGILQLLREWPAGVPLAVVGDGPLREEVQATAPHGVEILGEVSNDTISMLMKTARGLVFPSRWYEGLPMVYLESLAAGTPILAWEPSVVAGLVKTEGTGLVAHNLVDALAQAEGLFPALRARCRAVFDHRYTEQAWLTAIGQVFRDAISRRSPQVPAP
jgi:glycosyltransferase involved in cell wall biosynthesis